MNIETIPGGTYGKGALKGLLSEADITTGIRARVISERNGLYNIIGISDKRTRMMETVTTASIPITTPLTTLKPEDTEEWEEEGPPKVYEGVDGFIATLRLLEYNKAPISTGDRAVVVKSGKAVPVIALRDNNGNGDVSIVSADQTEEPKIEDVNRDNLIDQEELDSLKKAKVLEGYKRVPQRVIFLVEDTFLGKAGPHNADSILNGVEHVAPGVTSALIQECLDYLESEHRILAQGDFYFRK